MMVLHSALHYKTKCTQSVYEKKNEVSGMISIDNLLNSEIRAVGKYLILTGDDLLQFPGKYMVVNADKKMRKE